MAKVYVANNILGLAFSLQGLEHMSLGSTQIGALLLCGLFFYDIFWVFCTPVMVSVAKARPARAPRPPPAHSALGGAPRRRRPAPPPPSSPQSFDAPIKLLFPRGDSDPTKLPYSMLGLGDIVIPGFFIALMLRMDVAMGRQSAPRYFRAAVGGYVLGLGTTIAVMNIFNAAQPALLYIVPAVLGCVAARAAACGELKAVAAWVEDAAPPGGAEATTAEAAKKGQ